MPFAGHYPTMRFGLDVWRAMPVWAPKDPWGYRPDGYFRMSLRGRPIVAYGAPIDSGDVDFVVRPIVRVPMGRG